MKARFPDGPTHKKLGFQNALPARDAFSLKFFFKKYLPSFKAHLVVNSAF